MRRIRIGPIRQLYLFGGGAVLFHAAEAAVRMGMETRVVTSPRHAEEPLGEEGTSFAQAIRARGLPLDVLGELDPLDSPFRATRGDALGLSLGAAWIFREEMIRLFEGRLVNCHGSCLPEDRGGGGFSWRILRGDRRGRSLIHLVSSGVDSGDVIVSTDYQFPDDCRIPKDFFRFQRERDIPFVIDFLEKIHRGADFPVVPQPEDRATTWPRLSSKVHGAIDWSWTAAEVERFICAFDDPYPGAYTFLRGEQVHLKGCSRGTADPVFHPFQAGLIYRAGSSGFYVACREGNLHVQRVVDVDGRELPYRSWVGDRLWTPPEVLERSRQLRVRYTPEGPAAPEPAVECKP